MSGRRRAYKVRRDWLIAEIIVGAFAVTLGVLPLFPDSRLADILARTGDAILWPLTFIFFGASLALAACAQRRMHEMLREGHWMFGAVTLFRELCHLMLVFGHIMAIATLISAGATFRLLIMQSVILFVTHFRGVWEHVQAFHSGCNLPRDAVAQRGGDGRGR